MGETAPKSATPVKIGFGSVSAVMTPTWAAIDLGIFKKYGIEPDMTLMQGGRVATQALIAGEIQFLDIGASAPVQAVLSGADIVYVLAKQIGIEYQVVVAPEVRSMADLKGKSMGISSFGSSSDTATRLILRAAGLQPETDVAIVQVGSYPERLAAMESRAIQGTIMDTAWTLKARQAGFSAIFDARNIEYENIQNGVATTRTLIRENRELVRAYVKAMVEATHYVKTHPEEAIRLLKQYLREDDPDVLRAQYDGIVKAVLQEVPKPTPKSIATILEEVAPQLPAARTANPADFIDTSFVEELESSGFIRTLYGR